MSKICIDLWHHVGLNDNKLGNYYSFIAKTK